MRGVGQSATLEQPDLAALGHLLPQGEKEEIDLP
jgi:hypothetical protein